MTSRPESTNVNPILLDVRPDLSAAYLIGAIPFGYLIARWARGIDIRTVGSGNIGATNVGRVLGFRFFVLVFTLDLLKGFRTDVRVSPTVRWRWRVMSPWRWRCWRPWRRSWGTTSRSTSVSRGQGGRDEPGSAAGARPVAALAAAGGFGLSLLVTRDRLGLVDLRRARVRRGPFREDPRHPGAGATWP